jgi:hypothetical protein
MGTILGRLGYTFEDEGNTRVLNFSANAVAALNTVPDLLNEWQYEDLRENNVNGYYKNPVVNVTNSIITLSNSMETLALTITSGGFTDVINTANSIQFFTGPQFRDHTYRVSGVVTINDDQLPNLPHYDSAVAQGRGLTYIAYQSDNVTNSSLVMSSLTSILIEDDLNTFYNVANAQYYIVLNSLTDDGMGGNTSNLTSGQILNVKNAFVTINTTFETRRTHDETCFTNGRVILNDFGNLRGIAASGETQNNLLINYVGSDKLLERIDSANT